MRARPLVERVFSRLVTGDGCWTWTGSHVEGYPQVNTRLQGRGATVNRVSRVLMEWELGRPLRADEHVLHDCDNPGCVRPSHHYVGTNAQNVADRVRRGRGSTRLTETRVRAVRRRRQWGWSFRRIGEYAGVSETTVRLVCGGKTWTSVK